MNEKLYSVKEYKKNSVIFLEDSIAKPYFFIVQHGELECFMILHKKIHKYHYKKGDIFGLVACLTGFNYMERVIAIEDCTLITVNKDDIVPFLSQKKEIFYKIIQIYSRRLRDLDQTLISLCSRGLIYENPERLLQMAEYFEFNKDDEKKGYALKKYIELSRNKIKKKSVEDELKSVSKIYKGLKIEKNKAYVKNGDIIFLEQEKDDDFFYIKKGKVKISHIFDNKELIIAVLKENEFFGEMAILNKVSRNATAIALEDCDLLVINKNNFMDELGDVIRKKIFTSIATRIWFTYRKMLNLIYKNPVTRLYDYLDLLIASNEGRSKNKSYFFDLSLDILKQMTDLIDINDKEIEDFIKDPNIKFNYGSLAILDKNDFFSKVSSYVTREKLILGIKK